MKPELQSIMNQNAEQRLSYLLNEVIKQQEIWILTDEHGCVMLNTEDEDCVPVWPQKEFAKAWATGEWEDCQPHSIDLPTWQRRWTTGLTDDDVSVVVFPNPDEPGLVMFPDEFDDALSQRERQVK